MLKRELFRATWGRITTELLITFTPIIILALAFLCFGEFKDLIHHEEWFFIASVLFALSILKVAEALRHPTTQRHEWLIGIIFCIFLLGVLPTSFFTAKVAVSHKKAAPANHSSDSVAHGAALKPPSTGELLFKFGMVAASMVAFIWTAGVAHYREES